MLHPKDIRIQDYTYDLPDERIAKYPLANRDESKLLQYKSGEISESVFKNLPELLAADTLLVYNNTKVIRARLLFHKETGAKVEIFCLEPHQPADYAQSFQETERVTWRCMVGNARKWKDTKLTLKLDNGVQVYAEKVGQQGKDFIIELSWDNNAYTFSDIIEMCGNIPIPPYLNRKSEESDLSNYQTVYAKYKGSVAAPTAGLHFTDNVLDTLRAKGVETDEVTLHVGAGTFQPVKADAMEDHDMHTETISVSLSTLRHLKAKQDHIIAVGTTSVRTLESIFWLGNQLLQGDIDTPELAHLSQWVPYESNKVGTLDEVLSKLIQWLEDNNKESIHASTQIIIAPGYKFKIIGGMLTNFHQPTSTLLLLVSALVGETWRTIYDYALANNFRFLSYGDSSLLMKHE